MKTLIKKIIRRETSSSESYIDYLRRKGMCIGENCYIWAPEMRPIDEGRAKFIKIGNYCAITRGVIILAHDYSWSVLRKSHHDFVPTWGGYVDIGNNVFIGMNSIILKDVTIGDNVIIGAGSVVSKDIPSNVVCAGNPCRVICSLDEYYEKRKKDVLNQAYLLYKNIYLIDKRTPLAEDFVYFGHLFTEKNSSNRMMLASKINLNADDNEIAMQDFLVIVNLFKSFKEFTMYCKEKLDRELDKFHG